MLGLDENPAPDMKDLIRSVHINVPFLLLKRKYLAAILKNRINPEIGLDSEALDQFSRAQFAEVARILRGEGLSITLHAPFMDMVPGSPDAIMRTATTRRLRQVFELLPVFEPLSIVCHTGFEGRHYQSQVEAWLEASVESWRPLIELAQSTDTRVMLENVYEKSPEIHRALLARLNTSGAGFCFDIGHWNVFGRAPISDWLRELEPYLGQLHLHDNLGQGDAHLALGLGNVDFRPLFSFLKNSSLRPIITLEPHREEDVWPSIETLRSWWPWKMPA